MDNTLLKQIIERKCYVDERDGDRFGFEVFCDYDEYLSDESLAKISRADNPREVFDKIMFEWLERAEDYYRPELLETITSELDKGNEEYDEDEIRQWIDENAYWYMPEKHFDQEVDVVISLDVGDMNYDFTKCNILNWYGTCGGYESELDVLSPIHWLAEQQGKLQEVKKIIQLEQDEYAEKYDSDKFSKFATSVVHELQNACSHMNTMIFMVKMSLFEFMRLRELVKADEELNKSYTYEDRKGKGKFIVTKDAACGLYDIWGGGGSILEIELENDVVIPTKAIFDIWIDCRGCKANGRGYDVYDVYGLDTSAFTGSVKFTD